MFEFLLITAVLTLSDPTGDVVGADSLQPPTAGVYRNLAPFDLRQVTITDDQQLTLQVEMGSLSNPFDLPLGFSLPVIEIYLEDRGDDGGRQSLLNGSSMRLPQGSGWQVAIRLTGETAVAYRVEGDELQEVTPGISIDGNVLTVRTPFVRPSRPRVYAMTGLYDLFGASPWRPLETSESPWAFSSETQRAPVVDVLARTPAAQRQSIESQVLMPADSRGSVNGSLWLVLMAMGLFLALVGIAMRALARGISRRSGETTAEPQTGAAPVPHPSRTISEFDYPLGSGDSASTADSATATEAMSAEERAASSGAERTSETLEDRAAFKWDSSALLTQADEDDFADEFGGAEEPASGTRAAAETGTPERGSAVWERPVPLRIRQDADDTGDYEAADADPEDLPEVVRDRDAVDELDADEPSTDESHTNEPADESQDELATEEHLARDPAADEFRTHEPDAELFESDDSETEESRSESPTPEDPPAEGAPSEEPSSEDIPPDDPPSEDSPPEDPGPDEKRDGSESGGPETARSRETSVDGRIPGGEDRNAAGDSPSVDRAESSEAEVGGIASEGPVDGNAAALQPTEEQKPDELPSEATGSDGKKSKGKNRKRKRKRKKK